MPHADTSANDLIGSAEAARILGKSPRTVHRLVANGRLSPAQTAPGGPHGVWLYRRGDVERVKAQRDGEVAA